MEEVAGSIPAGSIMGIPKTTKRFGKRIHHSAGAIIKKDGKFLIMKRALRPPGYACVAGHIDKNEKSSEALVREVKEETNLDIVSRKFIFRKFITQKQNCVSGSKHHIFYVYNCKCTGKLKPNKREVKSIKYITKQDINKLYKQGKLEYAWEVILKKLRII